MDKRLSFQRKSEKLLFTQSPRTPIKMKVSSDMASSCIPVDFSRKPNSEDDTINESSSQEIEKFSFISDVNSSEYVFEKGRFQTRQLPTMPIDLEELVYYGNGSFADVYIYQKKKIRLIVKKYIREGRLAVNEAAILSIFKNKNIVKLHNLYSIGGCYYLITELCENYDFQALIDSVYTVDSRSFCRCILRKFMVEISSALAALHKEFIVHMDVKPANIFLRRKRTTKRKVCRCPIAKEPFHETILASDFVLGDFNISVKEGENLVFDGDKVYMAPEVLERVVATKSDIFSLGLIFLELFDGIALPTGGTEYASLRQNKYPIITPGKHTKIIQMMLEKDPEKRVSASYVNRYFKTKF